MTDAPEKIEPDELIYMVDLDGTGSMHPTSKGDPCAIKYVRADLTPRWHRIDDEDNPPPKDGTPVLLLCDRGQADDQFQITGYWDVGSVEFNIPGAWRATSHEDIYPPTHWMPLPTPPQEGE